MTIGAELLAHIVTVLYGPEGRGAFGARFGISPRKLSRMIQGRESIGPTLAGAIEEELYTRKIDIEQILTQST